ncbi:MAG: hypothetical protein QHJ73_09635, partial [Armatimonadota bacterium]|nr:hypothetical protein [Armatimonadota bacterium]
MVTERFDEPGEHPLLAHFAAALEGFHVPEEPFDPAAGELWEPLWGLRVWLTPCEQALLRTAALRRLRFV